MSSSQACSSTRLRGRFFALLAAFATQLENCKRNLTRSFCSKIEMPGLGSAGFGTFFAWHWLYWLGKFSSNLNIINFDLGRIGNNCFSMFIFGIYFSQQWAWNSAEIVHCNVSWLYSNYACSCIFYFGQVGKSRP